MTKDEKPKVFKFTDRFGNPYQIGDGGDHLTLTPEKLHESLREQAARAESSPHVLLSPAQAHIEQAKRLAIEWLEAGRAVEQELHQEHTKAERKELKQRFNHLMKLLAESLVTLGQYEEAIMVLPRHEIDLKRAWQKEYAAIWRNDDIRCGEACEKAFLADPTTVTRERVVKHVFSKKHGRLMPMVACAAPGCEMLNVRAPDGALAKQIEARAKAVNLMKGETPQRAKDKMTQAGLTAERVLKI